MIQSDQESIVALITVRVNVVDAVVLTESFPVPETVSV